MDERPYGWRGAVVDPVRLRAAKKAYITRHLAERLAGDATGYRLTASRPSAGDVVLARVAEIGKHTRLQSPGGRRQALFAGDEILVAYGNRYASDQFHAVVPDRLGDCSLVAGGGVAAQVIAQHDSIVQATRIEPLGLLSRGGRTVNLRDIAPRRPDPRHPVDRHAVDHHPVDRHAVGRPPVVAVLGTAMNSGKTTAVANLVRGLADAGLAVAAGKATGTGAANDPGLYSDAGAAKVLDFTDFGYPTTFRLDHDSVRAVFTGLIAALAEVGPDAIVIEVADGVYQRETARLLADPGFREQVDHVVFAATDSLGAAAGVDVLRAAGVEVGTVTGVLTSSPLAAAEASAVLPARVVATADLCLPATAASLVSGCPD
ncbi:DUF1611 domain-containing protein [Tomitella fengzijianii]|uniref:DUF1611 domain-containing protein n=1 Tax=Tomitella fengzijianii TaxID=2597660 RepID=A0A516X9K1_9ACTN|nr:DUF1611 domain-containing protein [Tomitella fengzijianii]